MNRNLILSGSLLGMLALASCSDATFIDTPDTSLMATRELTANIEQKVSTRSAVNDENGQFIWQRKDQIAVHDGSQFITFTYASADDVQQNAKFVSAVPVIPANYAVLPGSLNPTYASGKVTVTLPDTYTHEEGTTHAALLAEVDGSNSLNFKHLGGVIKMPFRNLPEGENTLVITAGATQLSGTFTVTQNTAGEKVIASTTTSTESLKKVQVTSSQSSAGTGLDYYIPVPVMANKAISVQLFNNGTPWGNARTATVTVNRKDLVIMPATTCTATASGSVSTVADASAAVSTLNTAATDNKSDVSVTVSAQNDQETSTPVTSTVTIPSKLTTSTAAEETKTVSLTFDVVPEPTTTSANLGSSETAVVITDNQQTTATAQASQSEVEIAIPQVTEEQKAPSIDVTLPTSTVTLSPTVETATFDKVVAYTAKNTLIVSKGVTVNTAIVRKGNMIVSGTVKEIINNTGETVYVYVQPGGSISNVGDDIVVYYEGEDGKVDFTNEATVDGVFQPYEISTPAQFLSMAIRINTGLSNKQGIKYSKCSYLLTNDIDMGTQNDWAPIGNLDNPFEGTINGNSHIVQGDFTITKQHTFYCAGLFGYARNARFSNLTLEGTVENKYYGNDYTASLVGRVEKSKIINCHNKATVMFDLSADPDYFMYGAGIASYASSTEFIACSNQGDLKNFGYAGGITTYSYDMCKLIGCFNTGYFYYEGTQTYHSMGGLTRAFSNGNMVGCWSKYIYTGPASSNMGGLFCSFSNASIVNHCYWYNTELDLAPYFTQNLQYNTLPISDYGTFMGIAPSSEQLADMNAALKEYGVKYEDAFTLKFTGGNSIPDGYIQQW